jgi:hypothetical protein
MSSTAVLRAETATGTGTAVAVAAAATGTAIAAIEAGGIAIVVHDKVEAASKEE